MTNGSPTRMYADIRPIAVSARTLRRKCCRSRTVSETVWKRSARLPPTSRWMITDMRTKRRSSESMRSAIAPSASSIGPAELGLVEHALELLARRRLTVVDDRRDAVREAEPDLERARPSPSARRRAAPRTPATDVAPSRFSHTHGRTSAAGDGHDAESRSASRRRLRPRTPAPTPASTGSA